MQIERNTPVGGAAAEARPQRLSAPTKVDVQASTITLSGKWLNVGNPAALVVRNEATNEKAAFMVTLGHGQVNDEITVTYHVEGLKPGKYVAALIFNDPKGPQARFSFEYGPKMNSAG